MTLPAAASPLAASDTLELVAWLRRARAPEKRPSISSLWIDAVEKVADDLRERFHLTFLGSGFVSVFVSFSVGTTDMGAGVQLSQVGSTDAQATHVAGMFSHGRQIWLARVFKF